MNRRKMLGIMGAAIAIGSTGLAQSASDRKNSKSGCRAFDVKEYGAVGDGCVLDTASINKAIDECHAQGGGIVYVPPGIYLSGTVILKSNVTLYLEAGTSLLGSKTISEYLPQPQTIKAKGEHGKAAFKNDLRDAAEFHLIFARDAENVGLAGPGKIDGQGSAFWVPSGRVQPPLEDSWCDVIAFDWKPLRPRPSPMLEFYNCKNLRIENVRIENAPGWTLRPIHCDDVLIRGIHIKNPVYGPNCDGIDVTCCHNVFISDCLIETGDDALCLKSENPYGERLRESKNITITNCVLSGCCNGFKFGTATHGGYENIVFSNSVIFNNDVPLNERIISGIAVEMVDGGWLEGLVISNIQMQRVRTPIFIRRSNRTPRVDGTPGTLRGVMIENLHATGAILTSSITGLPDYDVEDVTLSNIRIESEESGRAEWVENEIPELPKTYPEARMFGRLPAYGFYCRHVKGLHVINVALKATAQEMRPALVCDDVQDIEVGGLQSTPIKGSQPVVKLVQTRRAFFHGCAAPADTKAFLEVQGDKSKQIVLMNNNLSLADQISQVGAEVSKDALIAAGNVSGHSLKAGQEKSKSRKGDAAKSAK